jgi:hypothetical protein
MTMAKARKKQEREQWYDMLDKIDFSAPMSLIYTKLLTGSICASHAKFMTGIPTQLQTISGQQIDCPLKNVKETICNLALAANHN